MNIQAPNVSPEVAQAAASTRTPTDVLAARFLTSDIWQIFIVPRSLPPFALEMEWPEMTSRHKTLARLMDSLHDGWTAVVVYRPANAAPMDVSEDFARDYARLMFEGGSDAEAICDIGFIGRHLTNDEVDELCGAEFR